jgi:hypothetical protein
MLLFKEKKECCVCLEDKICLNLKCKHPLCNNCYSQLVRKICPLCRENLVIYQNLFQILSSTFIEIGLFIFIVLFVYYTDETIFHLSQRPHINSHKETNYSNIEMFFICLRLLFDIIRLFHS